MLVIRLCLFSFQFYLSVDFGSEIQAELLEAIAKINLKFSLLIVHYSSCSLFFFFLFTRIFFLLIIPIRSNEVFCWRICQAVQYHHHPHHHRLPRLHLDFDCVQTGQFESERNLRKTQLTSEKVGHPPSTTR